MKFNSTVVKEAAIIAAANAYGKATAELKVAEWRLRESMNGYCPETDAPVVAGEVTVSKAVAAPAHILKTVEEEAVEKRVTAKRKPKANKVETEEIVLPEAVVAPVVESTITGKDLQGAMKKLFDLYGGTGDAREGVSKILFDATGAKSVKELAPFHYQVAWDAIAAATEAATI